MADDNEVYVFPRTVLFVIVWFSCLLAMVVVIVVLSRRERDLPVEDKQMDCSGIVIVVLLSTCFGWIGLIIAYCFFSSRIEKAKLARPPQPKKIARNFNF